MNDTANWVVAGGTILLAVVAVFQDKIRRRVMRPRLSLKASVEKPQCHKTTWRYDYLGRISEAPCYYFRISIVNEGNTEARDVEVFAAGLRRQRAGREFENVKTFTPMNLLWSNFREPFLSILSPGLPKMCDLAHILSPDHARGSDQVLPDMTKGTTCLAFDLQVEPNMKGHLVGPGVYRLDLIVAAANTAPKAYVLEINFAGKWIDDEMQMLREGLAMKLL